MQICLLNPRSKTYLISRQDYGASADTGSETVLYKNISSNIVAQFHKTYNTKINNYNRKYNPFPY